MQYQRFQNNDPCQSVLNFKEEFTASFDIYTNERQNSCSFIKNYVHFNRAFFEYFIDFDSKKTVVLRVD